MSFKICNRNDCEFAYLLLGCTLAAGKEEKSKELKREIRRYNHRPVSQRRIVHGTDAYGYTVLLLPLPESIRSDDEARDWFMENEYIHFRPSPYDCTGQSFTSWYKLFQRNGKFWAYHGVSMDV